MTPQQRLQEAKDQAAAEKGYSSFKEALITWHPQYLFERAAMLMYEAGKKDQAEAWLPEMTDVKNALLIEQGKAETYRKALEEITTMINKFRDEDIYPGIMLRDVEKLASDALKGKP